MLSGDPARRRSMSAVVLFSTRAIVAGAMLIYLLLSSRTASACTCPPTDASEEFASSDAVFAGTVVAVQEPQPGLSFQRSFPFVGITVDERDPVHVTFRVSRVWKGPSNRAMTLAIRGPVTEQCFVEFVHDVEYIVYATVEGKRVATPECGRITIVTETGDDLAIIGNGAPPGGNDTGTGILGLDQRVGFVAGVALCLLLSRAEMLRVRSKRSTGADRQ